ncbi:MalY/PatB family protein [Candidatus Uabimicrobium amorphum]|uniref:cysteine-S-conjugate beta-lyase n=1 Tax=Uabimicrobium amorphum TaxID=2596890 RepID=A0A5S9ITI8_UABAM|nr:PatB family C-S lyase [Candidatus Uabimicrobium amorphum]BBM87654.1 aminotransferase [Candidatus Uabimicrobium amorphum]
MKDKFSFDDSINRRVVPALKTHPKILKDSSKNLFAAGVADMDFRVSPVILSALQKRLDHGVFGYEMLADGLLPALIQWLHHHHKWVVKKEHILRSPNILNALAIAASLFTEPGDGVIVQPPVFFDFFDILRENNRNLITNPLILRDGCYYIDFDDLEQKAAVPSTKMIYLCNPHNPVGRVWTEQELQQLGDICAKHNVLVVSDEMHGDLAFRGHTYIPFASMGEKYDANCITCLSPAKTFNIASCCCAFTVISDDNKRKAFQVENSRLTVNKNNAFANVAMEAAYKDGEEWLKEALFYLEKNVNLTREYLKDIRGVTLIEPQGTFLLWVDFRELGFSTSDLTTFLRNQAKWAVTRGEAFGEEGAGFMRVNIACTHATLESALDRLKNAMNRLYSR